MSSNVGHFLDQCIAGLHGPVDANLLLAMDAHFKTVQLGDLSREGTQKLRSLLDLLTERVMTEDGVGLLYTILGPYPPNSLTPVHPILVRHCCQIRRYDLALPLLSLSIDSFPSSHHLRYQDHLLYHFWAGLCSTALRDWSTALRFFSLVLTTGGSSTSLIQLEAYRKYLLISLLHHGESVPLPATLSRATVRSLETLVPEYLDLTRLYKRDESRMSEYMAAHGAELRSHGNGGLLDLVVASTRTRQIIRLQTFYCSLPLATLSVKLDVSVEEATRLVTALMSQGRISARINESAVEFLRNQETSAKQLRQLESDVQTLTSLRERMAILQKKLELDEKYLAKKAAQEPDAKKSNGRNGRSGMNDVPYPDEGTP